MSGKGSKQSGEDRLIDFFRAIAKHPSALGLADDAALLAPPAGSEIVATTDAIVAGVHFFADDPPDSVARKALRVNLSDLAAKGAVPLGALLTLALPEGTSDDWLTEFARGLGDDCLHYRCPLVGGDTVKTPGPLTISIAALGHLPAGTIVKRSGAKPGEVIVVTGTIGDAALGLPMRREPKRPCFAELDPKARAHLTKRYQLPEPRSSFASALRTHASAAIDISDGLAGDLAKLAAASGVSARIETKDVPLSAAARQVLDADPSVIKTILAGGDDYEILATVSDLRLDGLLKAAAALGIELSVIGRTGKGEGVEIIGPDSAPLALDTLSFSHF
ncbi:MAG TPA: thiamine-phosphate kinase [Xanthobacteraceae bacterium]|jgi:thiamine-monophosphate kinase